VKTAPPGYAECLRSLTTEKMIPLFKLYRAVGAPRMLPINLTVSLTYRVTPAAKLVKTSTAEKADELS